jgi:hypothetical protein
LPNPAQPELAKESAMEVALMLVSLPLMVLGGFALDAVSNRDDDRDDEDEDERQQPESGHPPII